MSACPLKINVNTAKYNTIYTVDIIFGIELKVNGDIVSILHVHCSLQQDQNSFEIND